MNTQYKIIEGFPVYRVGTDGSVWSRWFRRVGNQSRKKRGEPRRTGAGWYLHPTKWRKLGLGNVGGYPLVTLCHNGKRRRVQVHVLVLEAFVGPRPPGMDGCHNDGDTRNCNLDNLRWDTRQGNMADQLRHGTRNRGTRQGHVKLNEEKVRYIRREVREGRSQHAVSKEMEIHVMTVNNIMSGKTWGWLED